MSPLLFILAIFIVVPVATFTIAMALQDFKEINARKTSRNSLTSMRELSSGAQARRVIEAEKLGWTYVEFDDQKKTHGKTSATRGEGLRNVPKDLRSKVETLAAHYELELARGRRGKAPSETGNILALLPKLFDRLKSNGSRQQVRLAEVTYDPIVERLTELLSDAYYLDILENPLQWDDPKGRIAQVEEALVSVREQLTDNLKQVNASRDLEFQAHLHTLGAYKARPQVRDIYGPEPTG